MSSLLASAVSVVTAATGSRSTSGNADPTDLLDDITPTTNSASASSLSDSSNSHDIVTSTPPTPEQTPNSVPVTGEDTKESPEIENPGPLSRDHRQEVINFKAGAAAKLAAALNRMTENDDYPSQSARGDNPTLEATPTTDLAVASVPQSSTSSSYGTSSLDLTSQPTAAVTNELLYAPELAPPTDRTRSISSEHSNSGGATPTTPRKISTDDNPNGTQTSSGFWSFIPALINKVRVKARGGSNNAQNPNVASGSPAGESEAEDTDSDLTIGPTTTPSQTQSKLSRVPTTPSRPPSTTSVSTPAAEEKDRDRDGRLERENLADRQAARREARFLRLLDSPAVDLKELRQLAWKGVPPTMRAACWQILLGYLPQNVERRVPALVRKRREYALYLQQDYYASDRPRSAAEDELLDQIRKDLPRMVPKHPFFQIPVIQLLMERVLYIWAIRHPASGYVQGLNDVAIPLLTVFIEAATGHDIFSLDQIASHILGRKPPRRPKFAYSSATAASTAAAINAALAAADPRADAPSSQQHCADEPAGSDSSATLGSGGEGGEPEAEAEVGAKEGSESGTSSTTSSTASQMEQLLNSILAPAALGGVEADTFWCMTSLIDSIQDHYTFAQPGIQRMIYKLQELTNRVDPELYDHLVVKNGLQFVQFAFRWINCLLMREVGLHLIVRLWDTCLADDKGSGFEDYYVYLMLALLRKWRQALLKMDFQGLVVFLQHLPTDGWTEADIEVLTSEAYVYQSVYC